MSQYRTGSVNVVSGNATVTGVGTVFVGNVANGSVFTVAGSGVPYIVGAVVDNTHITLTSNYAGSTANGLTYAVTTSFTPNNQLPYPEAGDVDTATILEQAMLKIDTLLGTTLAAAAATAVLFVGSAGALATDVTYFNYNSTTHVLSLTSPVVTTSITTPSTTFTAFAGATTLLNLGGTGASASTALPSTLDSTSISTGSLRTAGGLGVTKALWVGGLVNIASTAVISASSATTALRVTQTGAGDVVRFEDAANPDTTSFIINAAGAVLVAVGDTALATGGTIQAAVQGSTISGLTTNTTSSSERAHWRLAVSDVEVASIGATNGSFYIGTAGTSRMTISSAGLTIITSTGVGNVLNVNSTNLEGSTTNTGVNVALTFGDTATVRGIGLQSTLSTEAAAFTLGEMSHFKALQGTIGAASAVTNQYGFRVDSTLTGAATNHGFSGNIAAASGRWNLHMGGTAQNYLAGVTGIGIAAASTAVLTVAASTTGVSSLNVPHGTAPSSPVNGDMWTTTAGLYVRINGATVGPLS